MHATTTRLSFEGDAAFEAGRAALRSLVAGLAEVPGVVECCLFETRASELVLFTLYDSEAAAKEASANARPALSSLVGPHVAGRPDRVEGAVVVRYERAPARG